MIKSQKQRLKQASKPNATTSYEFCIYQLQILNQNIIDNFHLQVKSKKSATIWATPKFKLRLPKPYIVIVDSQTIDVELYMEFQNELKMIASATIGQGADLIFMPENQKPGSKYCCIRYELREKQLPQSQKQHFSTNQNIFDSYLNGNQVSRIKYKQAKMNDSSLSCERIAFFGDYNDTTSLHFQQNKAEQAKNQKPQTNSQKIFSDKQQLGKSFQYERHGFPNYLDDSTSFIEDLLSCLPPNDTEEKKLPTNYKKQQLSEINQQSQQQNDDQLNTTAQKWYNKKFNKKNVKMKLKRKQNQKGQKQQISDSNNVRTTVFDNSFIENDEVIRQLSQFVTEKNIKIKSIDFSILSEQSDGKSKKLCRITKQKNFDSSSFNSIVILPKKGAIIVQCECEDTKMNGCMGLEQLKKGQCQLFSEAGQQCGLIYFKYKSISNFVMQTQNILSRIEESQEKQLHIEQAKIEEPQDANMIKQQQQIYCIINEGTNKDHFNKYPEINGFLPLNQKKDDFTNSHNENGNFSTNSVLQQKKQQISKKQFLQQRSTQIVQNDCSIFNKKTQQVKAQQMSQGFELNNKNQGMLNRELPDQNNTLPKISSKNKILCNNLQKLNQLINDNIISENLIKKKQTKQQKCAQLKQKQIVSQVEKEREKQSREEDKWQLIRKIKQAKMKKFSGYELTIQPSKASSPQQQLSPLVQSFEMTLPIEYNRHILQVNKKEDKNEKTVSDFILEAENDYNSTQHEHIPISQNRKRRSHFGPRHSKQIKTPFISLQPMQKNLVDPISIKYHRSRLNESDVSKVSIFAQRNSINLKIFSIHVNLHRPSYSGKIIKMRIDKNIYYTQTSKQLYFLIWKGKGYFFPNTSKNSILIIQLIQQKDNLQQKLGACKIHIPFLKTDEVGKILEYDDFIRSQDQQSVGRLILNYQIVEKRGKSLDTNNSKTNTQIQKLKIELQQQNKLERYKTLQKRKKKIKSNRYATQDSRADDRKSTLSTNRIPTGIGKNQLYLHSNILSHLNKNHPPLTRRKYIGGNILIPKASRFREDQFTKMQNKPGPGTYELVSAFDRHASPL